MITRSGESTVAHGAEGSQDTTTGNPVTDVEDGIFYRLPSSELLKHLLGADKKYCTRRENRGDSRTVVSQDSSKRPLGVIQCDDGINQCETFISLGLESPTSSQNGSMEEGVPGGTFAQQISDHLQHEQVQNSLHQLLSEQSVPINDGLPCDAISNETMDYILAEAQKTLHIQSPSSHESDSCEFTDLQPLCVSDFKIAKDSPCTSNERFESVSARPTESEQDIEQNSEVSGVRKCILTRQNSDSDSDVDEVMVLVPAGKY